jgi:hypothetical protein
MNQLPTETLCDIFNKLTFTEANCIRCVCRLWRDCIDYTFNYGDKIFEKIGKELGMHLEIDEYTMLGEEYNWQICVPGYPNLVKNVGWKSIEYPMTLEITNPNDMNNLQDDMGLLQNFMNNIAILEQENDASEDEAAEQDLPGENNEQEVNEDPSEDDAAEQDLSEENEAIDNNTVEQDLPGENDGAEDDSSTDTDESNHIAIDRFVDYVQRIEDAESELEDPPIVDDFKRSEYALEQVITDNKTRMLILKLQETFINEKIRHFNEICGTSLTREMCGATRKHMPILLAYRNPTGELHIEFTLNEEDSFFPSDYKLKMSFDSDTGKYNWGGLGENWLDMEPQDILKTFWNEEENKYDLKYLNEDDRTISYIFELVIFVSEKYNKNYSITPT